MNSNPSNNKQCFIISPIGKEGTESHTKYKDTLDYIIKPAIEKCNLEFNIIRADDINRTGSFVKDILENLFCSHLVIADMTNQNPNVFYELGIRHSLSTRTILIAQSIDDIPSDLRSYRTIIYDTSAKGAKLFSDKLNEFIVEINKNPNRPDNPVQDHLQNVISTKVNQYEAEIVKLKQEIENILKGKKRTSTPTSSSLSKRIERIFELKNAKIQNDIFSNDTTFVQKEKDKDVSYTIPQKQGSFQLYFVMNGDSIEEFWYISKNEKSFNFNDLLADIRILTDKCSKKQPFYPQIIITTNEDLTEQKKEYMDKFAKVLSFIPAKERKKFNLVFWDKNGLENEEKELGISID